MLLCDDCSGALQEMDRERELLGMMVFVVGDTDQDRIRTATQAINQSESLCLRSMAMISSPPDLSVKCLVSSSEISESRNPRGKCKEDRDQGGHDQMFSFSDFCLNI